MLNPAALKAIPAHTKFRGVSHNARGDVTEEQIQSRLDFRRAATGRKSSLASMLGYRVSVPIVAAFADLLPLYRYFLGLHFGRNLGPHMFRVEALNTGTDVLTITDHPFADGDEVFLAFDETAPTLNAGALSATGAYYISSESSSTCKLFTSEADALAGTNAIDFTADAVGDWWICRQLPLEVSRRSGVKRTYTNAVVEKLPDLVCAGGKLLFEGNLVFRCLPAIGSTPGSGDQASFYEEEPEAYTPPTWAGNEVLTKPVAAAWGGVAPWDSFRCEGGFRASFAPSFSDFDDGVWPGASLNYTDFTVEVKGKPIGPTLLQLQNAIHEDLGVQLDGADLVLTATGMILTLKQAILNPASVNFSPSANLSPELTWVAGGEGASDLRAPFDLAAS